MNVLIVIPIYSREELALNCICSLINTTIIPKGLDVTLSVGINLANDELKDYLKSVTSSKLTIKVTDFGENIGKASLVNRLSDFVRENR